MYDVDYTCYNVIWDKDNAYGLFASLLGLWGFIYTSLFGLDWIGIVSTVLWYINEMESKHGMLIMDLVGCHYWTWI